MYIHTYRYIALQNICTYQVNIISLLTLPLCGIKNSFCIPFQAFTDICINSNFIMLFW